MAAAMAFVACDKKEDFGTPAVSISASEIVLSSEAGDTTITVTATRDWTVTVDEAAAEWLAVDPVSGYPSTEAQTVTLSYFSNDGYDREASVAFSIGMQTKYLTVVQKGTKGSADVLVVYSNDFDKEVAEKTYGSGSSWPYLDQFDGWQNQTGSGAAAVTYSYKGMSARANSTSDSNYSDYPGSGKNNMFFGASPYFAIHGIALGGTTDFTLTFGTEKYSQDNGSLFKNSEFHVWLSADGTKWVELKDYVFAGGETEGRWNVAAANFSVPAGTETLSLCMSVDVASSYRMDDLNLSVAAIEGTKIDFSTAVAKDFGSGSTGGSDNGGNNGGGEVTPPADAFFVETFANGIGDFTIENKNLPADLEYVWKHEEYNSSKYMKATAYKEAAFAAESWLISPEVDLTNATAAYLSFDHTGKFFSDASKETTLWASTNGTDWTQLTIQNYTDNWKWVSSGNIDLKDFVGGKMKFAFKYLSSSSNAPTWEINNVCISAAGISSDGGNEGGDDTGGNTGGEVDNGSGDYDAEITFKDAGYTNAESVDGVAIAIDDNITATFSKASANNAPAYYDTGEAIRMYQNGATLDIQAANGKVIKEIRLTFGGNMYYLVADKGTLSGEAAVRVWTGSESSIKFTANGTDKNHRAYVAKIEVAYE